MSESLTDEKFVARGRWVEWFGGACLAVTIALLIVPSILKQYRPPGWPDLVLAVDLAATVPSMTLILWRAYNDRGWDEETARKWTDEAQRQRHVSTWTAVCLVTLLAGHTSYQTSSPSSWLEYMFIGFCWALAAFQVVGGWKLGKRKLQALGDDELTASLRAKAMKVGYVVLFFGVAIGFPASLHWPGATTAIFTTVMWLGFVVPALTLMWLENRAERDG